MHVLVCAAKLPDHDQESGSQALQHLIEYLCTDHWQVTLLVHSGHDWSRYAFALQQLGVSIFVDGITPVGDAFLVNPKELLNLGGFDLALLWSWQIANQYMPLIRRYSPRTRIIVGSVDLHFLRESRARLKRNTTSSKEALLDMTYGRALIREMNTYAVADIVLTVSQKEADIINDFTGRTDLAYYVPDAEEMPASPLGFAQRKGLLFVGGFLFEPNVDAVRYLCSDILPLLSEKLDAHPLYIVGYALEQILSPTITTVSSTKLVGWVPSVVPYYHQARLSVLPLRFGAGTKRKLLQSLFSGTPSVTTSLGAEGLGLVHEKHVLIADTTESFAAAILRLLDEELLWKHLADSGQALAYATHGREVAQSYFRNAVASALQAPPLPLHLNQKSVFANLFERIQRLPATIATHGLRKTYLRGVKFLRNSI